MAGAKTIRFDTTCDQCDQTDNHPKVLHGLDRVNPDGTIDAYAPVWHHDCTPKAAIRDILAGGHSQHPLLTAAIFRAASDGTHGDDLFKMIQAQKVKDYGDAVMMAKATTFANDVCDAELFNGASGTNVIGGTTYTWPGKCRFQSTLSTAGAQGTEFTASGGYTAGGVSLAGLATTAAASAAKANTGAVTVTNSPAGTWAGCEITDSSGTPKRIIFGPASSLAKTVSSGDTCTIPIGSLTTGET